MELPDHAALRDSRSGEDSEGRRSCAAAAGGVAETVAAVVVVGGGELGCFGEDSRRTASAAAAAAATEEDTRTVLSDKESSRTRTQNANAVAAETADLCQYMSVEGKRN